MIKNTKNKDLIGNPQKTDLNYFILESICHKEDKNDKNLKQFHVITLLGEKVINIGRNCEMENSIFVKDNTFIIKKTCKNK